MRYREKALQVNLYWKEGVYYFILIKDRNAELEIEGILPERGGYVVGSMYKILYDLQCNLQYGM